MIIMKTSTCITIDNDLKEKAKEIGLNISRFVNDKLEEEVSLDCRIDKLKLEIKECDVKKARLLKELKECTKLIKEQVQTNNYETKEKEGKVNKKIEEAVEICMDRIMKTGKLPLDVILVQAKRVGITAEELEERVMVIVNGAGIELVG